MLKDHLGRGSAKNARAKGTCYDCVSTINVRSYTPGVSPTWSPKHDLNKGDAMLCYSG